MSVNIPEPKRVTIGPASMSDQQCTDAMNEIALGGYELITVLIFNGQVQTFWHQVPTPNP